MKKLVTILLLLIAGLAQSQQLIKHNYVLEDEEAARIGKRDTNKIKVPLFKIDSYESFLTNFGGFNVLPKIQALGELYGENRRNPFAFKAFVAGTNIDSVMPNQINKLYFVDASNFGFDFIKSFGFGRIMKKVVDTTLKTLSAVEKQAIRQGINRAKTNKLTAQELEGILTSNNATISGYRFAVNLEAHYLGKSFLDTSSLKNNPKSFTSHFAHLKVGAECAVIPNNLSMFWNFNYATPLTGRDEYKALFNYPQYHYVFNEVGIQARLELIPSEGKDGEEKKGGGMDMYFTAGTIIHSGDTRSLSGGSDKVIPYIKLGLNIGITSNK